LEFQDEKRDSAKTKGLLGSMMNSKYADVLSSVYLYMHASFGFREMFLDVFKKGARLFIESADNLSFVETSSYLRIQNCDGATYFQSFKMKNQTTGAI
jgi:hypothetical protein